MLRARESAEAVRLCAAAGPPAAQLLDDPADALRRAPPLEASAMRVIDLASPAYKCGNSDTPPMLRAEWPTFDRHRSRWLVCQHLERIYGIERPSLLDLESATHHRGEGSFVGGIRCLVPRLEPACADLRQLWTDAASASEASPWLLLERPVLSEVDALSQVETVEFECHQLLGDGQAASGGVRGEDEGRDGGGGEEEQSKGDGGEEKALHTRRLRRGPTLRTTPASSMLRQLADSNAPATFRLRRPQIGEQLPSAANWRWLVLLDVSGVHILDFGGARR